MGKNLPSIVFVALVGAALVLVAIGLSERDPTPSVPSQTSGPAAVEKSKDREQGQESLEALAALVKPPAGREEKEGIAVAILMDASGSMKERVRDVDGSRRPKLEIAARACRRTIDKLEEFRRQDPGRVLKLGLYQFSGTASRVLLAVDEFRAEAAQAALGRVEVQSGTPIGEAILAAKHDLDRSGLTKKHILVLTDGENTTGRSPIAVARAIASLDPQEQAGIYFIAFQVEASRFRGIIEAGGTVHEATSAAELDACMDFVLSRQILLEKPEAPGK